MRYRLLLISIILLLLQPQILRASLADDLQNEINQKRDQIQALERQIAEYKAAIDDKKSEATTLNSQIKKLENQIGYLETQIKLTQTQIAQAGLKIQGLSGDIQTQEININRQKENLTTTIQTINEYDQTAPFELLLRNNDFASALNQFQYIENLQGGLQEKLTAIKELKAKLEAQKTDYEDQKSSLENLKTQLRGQSLALDDQKGEKNDLLATTKNQEKQYQIMLSDLQKKRTQIENEIFAAEQKLRAAINQGTITGGKGAFIRPAQGALTQGYGCLVTAFARKSYPACNEGGGNGGFHNGIDLAGRTGDQILAAADGTVSGTGNLGKYAYGKWITLKHDNGLTTLYGHTSVQLVSPGQKIKQGQVIGYVGSTGYSTGAHLHFTAYATDTFSIQQKWYGPVPIGGPVNPLLYLQ